MHNSTIVKVRRHLLDGVEVNAVQFWASWRGWAHHIDGDTLTLMREGLERGEVVTLGLQDFQLDLEGKTK